MVCSFLRFREWLYVHLSAVQAKSLKYRGAKWYKLLIFCRV